MRANSSDSFTLAALYKGNGGAKVIDVAIVVLLFAIIVGAPLPFGSVEYKSVALIETLSAVCLLLWLFKLALFSNPAQLQTFREQAGAQSRSLRQYPFFHRHFLMAETLRFLTFGKWPRKNPSSNLITEGTELQSRGPAYLSLFGFPIKNTQLEVLALVFFVLLVLQLLPVPDFLHRLLSPNEFRLYKAAGEVTGEPSPFFHPFSISPFHTLSKIVEYASYFFLYLVVVNIVRTRKLFWTIILAICISASFQSLYGLYEYLSGHQHIFSYQKRAAYDAASGTFINRNHYAVYLAMTLPLLVAIMLERAVWIKTLGTNFLIRMVRALETQGSQVLIFFSMSILVSVALICSLSRGGIVFALVSSIAFLVVYARKKQELDSKIYGLLFVAVAITIGAWIGFGPLLSRFVQISQEWTGENSRLQLWKDTFHIFIRFPFLGTGAGTFEQIFPVYRTSVYDYHFAHAHNDYLQALAENGFAVILLILAFFILLVNRFSVVMARGIGRLTLIQLGTFCSLTALGLHSLFDFSLQIPAIGIQASILTGLFYTSYHAHE